MRLYLSSFRLGRRPEHLVELIGSDRRPVAVIVNAIDSAPPPVRVEASAAEHRALAALGLQTVDVDLRDFFARPGRIGAELSRFSMVWLRGGNVFSLRHALDASGADHALVDRLAADDLVGAGYSAGPCVFGSSIAVFTETDDVDVVPAMYGVPNPLDGLGILDQVIVPHVDSPEHPASPMLTAIAHRLQLDGVSHLALRDGQALVVDQHARRIA
jgi:dipeptidase E